MSGEFLLARNLVGVFNKRAASATDCVLQINHMKRFIEQEAQEKAEEIMIKVSSAEPRSGQINHGDGISRGWGQWLEDGRFSGSRQGSEEVQLHPMQFCLLSIYSAIDFDFF